MTRRGFEILEKKQRKSTKEFNERAYVMNLLGADFDAVLGIMPEAEMCLVALGHGFPVAGEDDYWFEDCFD